MMGGLLLRFMGLSELALLAGRFLFLRRPVLLHSGRLLLFLSRREYPRSRVPASGSVRNRKGILRRSATSFCALQYFNRPV